MSWHSLEPCDETFFQTAPFVYRYPVELSVPPERVWQSLTSDRALADWGIVGMRRLTWTSPRPFGVGTTREVELTGNLFAVREVFFRWDEGVRKSFYATEVNRAVLRRFAEDYLVEPTAAGSRFTWTIALEPTDRGRAVVRLLSPANRLSFHAVPIRAKRYFAKHP